MDVLPLVRELLGVMRGAGAEAVGDLFPVKGF